MRFFCGVDDCLTPPVAAGFVMYQCGEIAGLAYCFIHQVKGREQIHENVHPECEHIVIEFDVREFINLHPELNAPDPRGHIKAWELEPDDRA